MDISYVRYFISLELEVRQYSDKFMTNITYRPAHPDDASLCIKIRGLTRENTFSSEELHALGITTESWSTGIRDGSCPGFVACDEGLGIGKSLLAMMVDQLKNQGLPRVFLACSSDPNVRSYGFYRHLGWSPTGKRDDSGDDILELKISN
ncbi:GNAT family N-acetyltransferase [Pseudomonas putida]|uniref:GNAT family N-acetyltransferase n=1 Tax=Pseudomonas putida TaxID=303 RepID=UPI003905D3CC